MNTKDAAAAYASYGPSPEERAAGARYHAGQATARDLLLLATGEARRAVHSLPPHCLPTKGGLPENPDHANACAHRCLSYLTLLAEKV